MDGQCHALALGKENLVPLIQWEGWVLGPLWTGAEDLASTWVRTPNRQARLRFAGRLFSKVLSNISLYSYVRKTSFRFTFNVLFAVVICTCVCPFRHIRHYSSSCYYTYLARSTNSEVLHYVVSPAFSSFLVCANILNMIFTSILHIQ